MNNNESLWKDIAPFFVSNGYDCAALSISGCGDSTWRDKYSTNQWGREVFEVTKAMGYFSNQRSPPIIVAHSLGCYITLDLALEHANMYGGIIFIDAAIRDVERSEQVRKQMEELRKTDITYKQRDGWNLNVGATPLERMKLRPYQTCPNTYFLKFIANSMSKQTVQNGVSGWVW